MNISDYEKYLFTILTITMMAHRSQALTTDGMTDAETSVPSTGANPEQRRTSADTAISDRLPSSDVNAPVAIALGEVVKGRLSDSSQNGKCHYWSVELPAGKYKFVLDVKGNDDQDSNVGGQLNLLTSDGQEEIIGDMIEIDRIHRETAVLNLQEVWLKSREASLAAKANKKTKTASKE